MQLRGVSHYDYFQESSCMKPDEVQALLVEAMATYHLGFHHPESWQ